MTVTDQIKILNKKINQNEAQHDLDKNAAKISALYSNNLDKNEQLLKTKNKIENVKEVTAFAEEPLSPEAKVLIEEIRTMQKDVDCRKLIIRSGKILCMILVIVKYLKSYLENFITTEK